MPDTLPRFWPAPTLEAVDAIVHMTDAAIRDPRLMSTRAFLRLELPDVALELGEDLYEQPFTYLQVEAFRLGRVPHGRLRAASPPWVPAGGGAEHLQSARGAG